MEISTLIKDNKLALFCGAGFSKNSGMPLSNELKKTILKMLFTKKEDIDEIMEAKFPFEAFMEPISENEDIISRILAIFENGKPNINHILIAKLAKKGYLKAIITTNFDKLIEKALEENGLKRDKDFEV